MKPLHNPDVDALFDAILSLNDREECYAFFEDACTIKEILDISSASRPPRCSRRARTTPTSAVRPA